jgi:4-amino-4-deoxy-L-arabinose transferase-like glycosyltransferase
VACSVLRVARGAGRLPWQRAAAWSIIAWGATLRVASLTQGPFHPDECLYATWALAIARHGDPLLRSVALDKPPLYPYLLAAWAQVAGYGPTSLRLLGIVCSLITLALLARLARAHFGGPPGLACLSLAALAPVAVALDGTVLTDPMAVTWATSAVVAAASGALLPAGALLGLAAATKPQLLAYLPLVVLAAGRSDRRQLLRLLGGLAVVGLCLAGWEALRSSPSGFIVLALEHYGGFRQADSHLVSQWASLLGWVWGNGPVAAAWLVGCMAALGIWWRMGRPVGSGDRLALGAAASLVLYTSASLALGMPAWDRYALPAVPLLALLTAWALTRIGQALPTTVRSASIGLAGLSLVLALARPAQEAAQHRLPLGDTSRWQGIETVTEYIRGQVPGRATLLYQEYGWHLRYYLDGFPQDMRWFSDDTSLLSEVGRGTPSYVLLPANDGGRAQMALLRRAGYALRTAVVGYGRDGQATMALLLVERESR